MSALAARLALVLAAVAVTVWLGLALRSERNLERASAAAFAVERLAPTESERNIREARDARRFVPDASPKLIEWRLLLRERRAGAADALLAEIVRDEPSNFEAWYYLSRTAREPRLAREARRRAAELRPPRS